MCRLSCEGGRRCPSQTGATRNAYQRALYAARQAARTPIPATTASAAQSLTYPATDHQIQAAIAAADHQWDALRTNSDPARAEDLVFAYERSVQQVGALVASQVDEELRRGLNHQAVADLERRHGLWLVDADQFLADDAAYDRWVKTATAQLARGAADEDELADTAERWEADLDTRRETLRAQERALKLQWNQLAELQSRITVSVLARYRAYGNLTPHLHHAGDQGAQAMVIDAARVFPDAWITLSDQHTPLRVVESAGRDSYAPSSPLQTQTSIDHPLPEPRYRIGAADAEQLPPPPILAPQIAAEEIGLPTDIPVQWVAVHESDNLWYWRLRETRIHTEIVATMGVPGSGTHPWHQRASTIHELAHRIERLDPRIPLLCKTFRRRRTQSRDGTPASTVWTSPTEEIYPDQFVHTYVGRRYGRHGGQESSATEILAVGMEAVFGGKYGGLIGHGGHTADHEHRHLVLGLCAAI